MIAAPDPLASLEHRLDDLLTHLHEVRRENRALRLQVQQMAGEKSLLAQRIDHAAERLQALRDSLPDDDA